VRIHNIDYILLSPGDQSNSEGDYVYLDLQSLWGSVYAGLNTQAPLMFSAYNLPAGLSIDRRTTPGQPVGYYHCRQPGRRRHLND